MIWQVTKPAVPGDILIFFKNTVDMDTPAKMKTLAYYDVVNFAKQITVPVYMTWGFNDNTVLLLPVTLSIMY